MFIHCSDLLSRMIIGVVLTLMITFGGFHSDFSTPAFAQSSSSSSQSSDNGNGHGEVKRYTTFNEAAILKLSPKQLKELQFFFLGSSDGFILAGFDKNLSYLILRNLTLDVTFTKAFIRKMRAAKNAEEKLKILAKLLKSTEKLEKELVAESNEFAIGFGDLFGGALSKKLAKSRRLSERFAEWRGVDRLVTRERLKIKMLLAWKKKVLKKLTVWADL